MMSLIAEWHDAKVDNKDEYSVPYFEEEYTQRGTLIDQLMDEDMFKDKRKKSCEIIEKDDGGNVRSHLFDVFIV